MVSKTRKNKEKLDIQLLPFLDEASRNSVYQDIEERRLKEWDNFQKSHRTPEDQQLNRAFIDVSIGDAPAGRLVVDLYDHTVPKTVEHFRSIITGEHGVDKDTRTKIDFLYSKLQKFDKQRGVLCFGSPAVHLVPTLDDENFSLRHTERGLLTMISYGPNSSRQEFGITTGPAPSLDFKQVVFGKVVDGFSILEKIESLNINAAGRPITPVFITFCGVLTGKRPPGVWQMREKETIGYAVWESILLSPLREKELPIASEKTEHPEDISLSPSEP